VRCDPRNGLRTYADLYGPDLRGVRPAPTMEVASVQSHSSAVGDCSVPLRLKEFRTPTTGMGMVGQFFQIIPDGCWDTAFIVTRPSVLSAGPLYVALAMEQPATGVGTMAAAGDLNRKYAAIGGGETTNGFLTLLLNLPPTDASLLLWSNDGVLATGGVILLDVTLDMGRNV